MDDLEIIKALGCCCNHSCVECFYAKCDSYEACTSSLHSAALDLINRQRAEIEKLSNHILDLTKMIKAVSIAPAMCYDSSVEVIRKASIDSILREMEANR